MEDWLKQTELSPWRLEVNFTSPFNFILGSVMYVVLRVTGNQPLLSCLGRRIYCHEVMYVLLLRENVQYSSF